MNLPAHKKLTEFFEQHKSLKLKKGEVLLREDDPVFWTYYVVNGVVKEYTISMDGTELTIKLHQPGSLFPKDTVLDNSRSANNFETVASTEVLRIQSSEFMDFIVANPDVLMELSKEAIEEKNDYSRRLGCMLFCHAYTRVLYAVMILARYFGEKTDNKVVVKSKFTQKEIASLAGVTRETANGELTKMVNAGLISMKDKSIIINDIGLLSSEVEKRKHRK